MNNASEGGVSMQPISQIGSSLDDLLLSRPESEECCASFGGSGEKILFNSQDAQVGVTISDIDLMAKDSTSKPL